jgi:hypothetical protein
LILGRLGEGTPAGSGGILGRVGKKGIIGIIDCKEVENMLNWGNGN